MENTGISHGELNLDTRVLSNFIIEFNISLRLVTSHPPNHPIITASIGKVLRHLAELLEFREELTVGVARDTLMVGYALLDPKNPVYRNLARVLFDRDIAAVTIHKNITSEELLHFNEIMAHKREYLRENGGIEEVVSNAGIRNILPRAVNYGYFRTTEEERMLPAERNLRKRDASAIWEHFVHGLLDGTLDPKGNHTTFANVLDPGALAEIVNGSELREESYATVIASFMGDLDNVESESRFLGDSIEKLSKFVSRLNPELRRQFLNGVFTCAGTNRNITEEMLARFPDDIILDALACKVEVRFSYNRSDAAQDALSQDSPCTVSTAEDIAKYAEICDGIRKHKKLKVTGIMEIVAGFIATVKNQADPLLALAPLRTADEYTFTHSTNVCILNLAQAMALGIDGPQLNDIGIAAMLHDVGKFLIPEEVLNKPGSLDDDEWEIMRQHSLKGARYLLDAPGVPHLAVITAYEHHIKHDFTGYPAVSGQWRQNLCSRMTTVSDCFDAARTRRPYRGPMEMEDISRFMLNGAGTHFHPALARNFLKIISGISVVH